MKKRQRISKADAAEATVTDSADATHRLTGISVKEVSIVDRAANKRKYLLVKEDEKGKQPDVAKSADDAAKGDADATKAVPGSPAQPAAPPTPPGPPTTPQAPTLRISPELKAQVAGLLKTLQERVGVITKVLEGSSETPGAAAPPELMDALKQLAQMISQVAAPTPAAGDQPPPDAQKEDGKTDAEKAGRALSADRLSQLTTIRDSLNALIDGAAPTPAASGEPEPAAASGGTEPAPAASGAEKSAAPSPEIVALQTAVTSIADSMANMTKVFEQQNARIAELSKSRGESRQPDLDRQPTTKKEEPVVWDMDMARPLRSIA